MNKIRILVPVAASEVTPSSESVLQEYKHLQTNELVLSASLIESGPETIESLWEEAACIPGLAALARGAEREGIDGLVIDCMGDPGVDVLREIVSIPVLGPGHTSMKIASLIGRKFAILTPLERTRSLVEAQTRLYGMSESFAGCEIVDLPVREFSTDPSETLELLVEASQRAVRDLKADVIIPGCTSWSGYSKEISTKMDLMDNTAVVLDPMPLTIRILLTLIDESVSHSKYAYPTPGILA